MRNTLLGMVFGVLMAIPLTGLTDNSDTYHQLDLFGDVFERIHSDYVTEVDDADLVEAAINGMLASLDPHSNYLNPDNYRNVQVQTRGEFGGLGIEVTMEEGVVKVVSPIDDTPAARAGIEAGDMITHLNGEPILGLTLQEAVDKMRGPVHTKLELTVVRQGVEKAFDVTIVRDIIRVQSVRFRREKNVAYVRITQFNEQTKTGLEHALRNLEKEIGNDIEGIVLDLRNNPGGLLDQAIAVSDTFLNQGEIVSTRGRNPRDSSRWQAEKGDLADGLPIIVLINGGSASASEIVAGALQDHRRAIILGTRSFGKGSVQTIIPLSSGSDGALKLTTAKYFTPSGRSIQAKGIDPDILVKLKPDTEGEDTVKMRSEADLRNHLDAEEGAQTNQQHNSSILDNIPAEILELERPLNDDVEDYQLTRALQILHGIRLNTASMESATSNN